MIVYALKRGDSIALTLPKTGWNQILKVNGIVTEPGEYTVTGNPRVELFEKVKVHLYAKSNVSGLSDLSLNDYYARREELSPKKPDPHYPNELIFESIHSEYAYKVFLASYTVLSREDLVKIEDVELSIVEDSGVEYPFITPTRFLGEAFGSPFAVYHRKDFLVDYLKKKLDDNGYVEESDTTKQATAANRYKLYHYSSDVSLYIGQSRVFEYKETRDVRDHLSVVTKLQEQDRAAIDKALEFYLEGRRKVVNAYEMSKVIEGWISRLEALDVKVRSSDDARALRSSMREQIERLKELT